MRGHDNRIECAVFVPQASIPAVRELVALVNSHHVITLYNSHYIPHDLANNHSVGKGRRPWYFFHLDRVKRQNNQVMGRPPRTVSLDLCDYSLLMRYVYHY